ncbi:MAG TPA: hypothetical protein VKX17_14425 [Planctomycetota bacterium]|nr:hypothetical protein [Planctomycetota bacterium]
MRTGLAVCLELAALWLMPAFAGNDLQQVYPRGTAEAIDNLDANAIAEIQFLRLDWFKHVVDERDPSLAHRLYSELPLTPPEGREKMAALLQLIKAAPKFVEANRDIESHPDYVMVVRLRGGNAFEIWYNSGLKAPFAGRYSLALKEALWSMSHSVAKVCIIDLADGNVKRTLHEIAIPHGGGVYSGTLTTKMNLSREKGLTLYLRLTAKEDFNKPMTDRKVEMEDEHPVHFGESTVYKSNDGDTYVVLVQQESPIR